MARLLSMLQFTNDFFRVHRLDDIETRTSSKGERQSMRLPGIGYALLCVAVPMAWGLLVVLATNLIEKRVRGQKDQRHIEEVPPIDYHI